VELVGVLNVGPGFIANPLDGCRIESTQVVGG
jgi:hypothetical protein